MTSTCPACNKSVDPLRSRFVRVVRGKVVAYCSAECAREQGGDVPAAASRAVSPASGVPVPMSSPSSGVPARSTPGAGVPTRATPGAGVPTRATPGAGVPTRATPGAGAARSTPAGGVPAPARTPPASVPLGPPSPSTPTHGVPVGPDSGPVIEILHEPASGVVTSARDARDEGTQPRARHPDEIPIAAFWSADRERSGAVGATAAPGSGPVARTTAVRDDTLDKWTTDTGDRAHVDRPASAADAASRPRSRLLLALLILLLLAAGGFFAYQYLLRDLAAATRVPSPPGASALAAAPVLVEPAQPPSPPPVDVAAAIEHARATLRAGLTASSPRLQRIAAAALARTQDPAARDVLAAHVGLAGEPPPRHSELSDIARLDVAYSLARSGDRRGNDAIAAALGSQRAEARDEAARLLALLGDRRAVARLVDLLAISQRRLGAAEHLAHLADPHAIKVLEQIRGNARASADDKARAIIALGIAGDTGVAPTLRGMLSDPHFNAFAAGALAELKDDAARPVLEHQLDSPSLRVRAARALRRLDPALDPGPLLPRLLEVLTTGRDRDQVQAAEAILLLAGPASWSSYE